ncbi:hypothetical protein Tco_0895230 [Tanacetum coccineum]|uniref:Uncharacterized protein n=1 Tax=Tanacetum coccineum TaxID=301880 RepID=A0ABQ5CGL4_9ASTR
MGRLNTSTPYRSYRIRRIVMKQIRHLDNKTQYAVLIRRFDTSYPTGGYGVSGNYCRSTAFFDHLIKNLSAIIDFRAQWDCVYNHMDKNLNYDDLMGSTLKVEESEGVGVDLITGKFLVHVGMEDIDNIKTIDNGEFVAATVQLNHLEQEDYMIRRIPRLRRIQDHCPTLKNTSDYGLIPVARIEGITIKEYLTIEDKKMEKQSMNSSFEKLWYLADEDDEEETYVFDMNEFPGIQIRKNLSSKSVGTHKSLYSTLDEKYDAIAYDFSPELEFLLASESHTAVHVCSLDTFKDEYKEESKVFNLLKIDVDLFTCDTPLGMIFDEFSQLSSMEDDLFTYEEGVLEPSYFPCVEQPYDDLEMAILIFVEHDNLKFGNHKKVDKEIKEVVVATWLIRSYKKQFKEYMEIKRRLEVDGVNTDVEFDPTNVEFIKWLAFKFNNHKTMDWYTKNALWLYWKRSDDEEVLTDNEFSDLEKENLHEGFKTYEDYKNTWYYEWNNEVPWVDKKPWLEDGIWKEPTDDICHQCKPFCFKNGHAEWPTYYELYEGLENGDLKEETLKEKAILEGSWGHENTKGNNFFSWLKEKFCNYHELDYELMLKLEEYWWRMKEEEESSEDA